MLPGHGTKDNLVGLASSSEIFSVRGKGSSFLYGPLYSPVLTLAAHFPPFFFTFCHSRFPSE